MLNYSIYESHYLNQNAIFLENDLIRIAILPNIGFKVASIFHKKANKELLFQPTNKFYKKPISSDLFENYDTSGIDDMFPTIDSCYYPVENYKSCFLPDHGFLWSLNWEYEIDENRLIGFVNINELNIKIKKFIFFENDNTIVFDYNLINNNSVDLIYLWALHPLFVIDDNTELLIPDYVNKIINVKDNDFLGDKENEIKFPEFEKNNKIYNLKKINDYPDNNYYKFYIILDKNFDNSNIGLIYNKEKLLINFEFDVNEFTYLGIWLNKGKFKGEYNIAIEPTNGFYDSLELAYKNNKYGLLKGYEEKLWKLKIKILNK